MFPYPLEDFLQVGQHGLFRGMVDIGKLLDGSLLAADAEILLSIRFSSVVRMPLSRALIFSVTSKRGAP